MEREGIKNNTSVVGATDALASANARLAEARHDAARTAEAAGGCRTGLELRDGQVERPHEVGASLRHRVAEYDQVPQGIFGPAVSAVLGGVACGLAGLPQLLAGVRPAFTQTGPGVRRGLPRGVEGADQLPSSIKAINGFSTACAALARLWGDRRSSRLEEVLGNMAAATMPLLVGVARVRLGCCEYCVTHQRHHTGCGRGIQSTVNVLKSVGSLVGSIGGICCHSPRYPGAKQ